MFCKKLIFFYLILKVTNEITSLISDYTINENLQLYKGQHVQIIQRLNNEFCLVQLLNSTVVDSPKDNSHKQFIEFQIPISILKSRNKIVIEG